MKPGELIAERFRLVRFIARGGMGEVFEAEDCELDQRVAVKIVRQDVADDPTVRERIRREVQLARQITHRNVCRLYDVFTHSEVDEFGISREMVGLSMELLEGETLDQRIAREGPLEPSHAMALAEQMTQALAAAHEAGVLHRDFKSANVMLVGAREGTERVVVTDFGLARSLFVSQSPLTGVDLAVGTADYMAPEQAEGHRGDVVSDIYALGVVLFEMVTGCRPHTGETPLAVVLERIRTHSPSPREFRPELDPVWERVILRCLERRPRDRYQTAAEVLAALRDGGRSRRGLRGSVDEIWWWLRSLWRGRWRGMTGAAAVVGAIAVVAFLLTGDRVGGPHRGLVAGSEPVQLSTWEALEVDPSYAPDGRHVAFSSNRDGGFEIYLLDLHSAEVRQITQDHQENFQPAFSPGGELIAYASHGRGGLWVIPRNGGEPRQVTDFGSHPAWSQDGSRLLFQSDVTAELSANAAPATPPSTIWVVEIESGELTQLTQPGNPAGGHGGPQWSPDGARVVFSSSVRTWSHIWSVAADGSGLASLVTEVPAAFDPVPGPRGHYLYYSTISEGERYGVWRVAVDWASGARKGLPELVTSMGLASIRRFSLSPDGHSMIHTALSTRSNLWSLPLDAGTAEPKGDPHPLTEGSGRNSRPAFAPDGSLIAFDRWRVGSNQDIWVMGADGSEARPLTRHPDMDTQPSWFPDGERVAFVSQRDGQTALWAIRIASEKVDRLAVLGAEVDWVRLAPAGDRIAFHWTARDRATNVWVALTDGSQPQQISFDRELMGYPCWSPDGRLLAFEMKRGSDDYVVIGSAAGGEIRQLTSAEGKSWPYSWSPDGDKIAFAGLRSGRWNIFWVSRNTGEVRQLTHWNRPDAYARYPAWSPRGDQIVFELADTAGDLWLLEDLD